MDPHDWLVILETMNTPSTDRVEHCRRCGLVRHSLLINGRMVARYPRLFRHEGAKPCFAGGHA